MGEIIRHFSNGGSWSLELVNARSLSDNGRTCASRFHCSLPDRSPTKRRIVKGSKGSTQPLKLWWNDPERRRQSRISSYKYYSTEANVKRTFKKGLRWLGKKCSMIIPRF